MTVAATERDDFGKKCASCASWPIDAAPTPSPQENQASCSATMRYRYEARKVWEGRSPNSF